MKEVSLRHFTYTSVTYTLVMSRSSKAFLKLPRHDRVRWIEDDDESIFRPRSDLMGYWAVPTTPAGIVTLFTATYNI